jgi:putative SOS response-associated peptidase YedK
MCGRYALISDPAELAAQFDVAPPSAFAPRYNIAPSQPVLLVRNENQRRTSACLQWGLLPSWSKEATAGRRPINARAETVAEKPSFRAAFRRRRCLVPADGYYEWAARDGTKQPYFIYRDDRAPFAIAGLWEYWERDGNIVESCALLTCAANGFLSRVHHRMPVLIEPKNYALWLSAETRPDALGDLLTPANDDIFALHAVTKRVNSPANDSQECIDADDSVDD